MSRQKSQTHTDSLTRMCLDSSVSGRTGMGGERVVQNILTKAKSHF